MSVPYIVNFEHKCTDCGINTGVFSVTYDFNEIDICQECLDKRNKIYDHSVSFNFSFETKNETPTVEEMIEQLTKKLKDLSMEEIKDSFEVYDTEEKNNEAV